MKNPLLDELYHSRIRPRKPDLRGDYFRDQTAIIHSSPFRRLKHKTQVFFSPEDDHICTRIEHVLHVSTIATTICKALDLDVELAQAMSLGHDLGHAPFGHVGETILNKLARRVGGFIHEVHGLRVVDLLTRRGEGLNLTYAVRDGIVSHCGEDFAQSITPQRTDKELEKINSRQSSPITYEGCVVRVADKIAYLGRDIEDAISAGLITTRDIPKSLKKNLGSTNGEIIDTLVLDLVKTSEDTEAISFSDSKYELICQLKDFNYQHIYGHPVLKQSDDRICGLLEKLFNHLSEQASRMQTDPDLIKRSPYRVDRHFKQFVDERKNLYDHNPYPERSIVDFIAGMTDSYALDSAREILFPRSIPLR